MININRSRVHRGITRRQFVKGAAYAGATVQFGVASFGFANGNNQSNPALITKARSFQGMRKDPVTSLYLSGNGTRAYSPRLMRFNSLDGIDFSPFGKGGVHNYAFVSNNPTNYRDPTGHVGISALLVGEIIGSVAGAVLGAAAESIKTITTGESFDWKQVGIGAFLGFISGGFGAASSGAKNVAKVGLYIGDAVATGAIEMGISMAEGDSLDVAGGRAGIGAVIGLATFRIGSVVGKAGSSIGDASTRLQRIMTQGLSGRGAKRAARRYSSYTRRATPTPRAGASVLETVTRETPIGRVLAANLDAQSIQNLSLSSRSMFDNLYYGRMEELMSQSRFNNSRIRQLAEQFSAVSQTPRTPDREMIQGALLDAREYFIRRQYSISCQWVREFSDQNIQIGFDRAHFS